MKTFVSLTFVNLFILHLNLGYSSRLNDRKTVDDYLNICLLGENHKVKPGPESNLFLQCTPWKSHSCCRANTTESINTDKNFLNFNWDHCKELSERCRQNFIQDLCFYECSPYVGPWLVEDLRKIRNERFVNVPLCRSDCVQWWDACKDDFTCVENWAEDFNWSSRINTCPEGKKCRPMHEVYSGPEHFCENLFGPSFKVVPDAPEECFHRWFDPEYPNPNEAVARRKVKQLLGGNTSSHLTLSCLVILIVFLHLCGIMFHQMRRV